MQYYLFRTYKTPINFLREMIDSVIDQTYSNWELCIADGSEGDAAVEAELEKYGKAGCKNQIYITGKE